MIGRSSSRIGDCLTPEWDDMVLVGRIARPHGLRGQVVVNPETDFVEERFAGGRHVLDAVGPRATSR